MHKITGRMITRFWLAAIVAISFALAGCWRQTPAPTPPAAEGTAASGATDETDVTPTPQAPVTVEDNGQYPYPEAAITPESTITPEEYPTP